MALTDSAGILLRIRADASQAEKEFQQFRKEFKDTDKAIKDSGGTMERFFLGFAQGAGLSGEQAAVLKTNLSSILSVATVAATGIAAIGTAAVGTAAALFKLSQEAADFGSAIFDAQQKTGLSAETLSAFKAQAEQSGSSFEQLTKGITVFGVEVGKAAQSDNEAIKKMRELGVTSNDLDTALKQVFKTIVEGKSDTDRLALASEAFGKKIGPDLVGLIKDTNGDIDAMTKHFKDLGATIDDDAAKAADEFGDQLDTLSLQFASVGRAIGRDFMPIFLDATKAISGWLVANQTQIHNWAQSTSDGIRGAIDLWTQLTNAARDYYTVATQGGDPSDIAKVINRLNPSFVLGKAVSNRGAQVRQEAENAALGPRDIFGGTPGLVLPNTTQKELEDAAKEREAARKRDLAAQKDHIKKLLDLQRDKFEANQKALEDDFKGQHILQEVFLENSEKNLNNYAARAKKLLLDAFKLDAVDKNAAEIANLRLAKESGNLAIDREVAREREARDKLITASADKEKKERDKLQKEELELAKEISRLWIEQVEAQVEAQMRLNEQLKERNKLLIDGLSLPPIQPPEITPSTEGAPGDEVDIFAGWKDSWESFFESYTIGAEAAESITTTLGATFEGLAEIGTRAFEGMANAIGSVIEQWVLYGNTGPAVMRKILASALASIAAEAAVRAIYSAAWGFYLLSQGNFAQAGNAFVSAAMFGAIAVAAALAGRAVAGDSFKKQTASQTGGASGGSSGSTSPNVAGQGQQYSGQKDAVINRDINDPSSREPATVLVKFVEKPGWFANALDLEVTTNGRGRQIIKTVAQES